MTVFNFHTHTNYVDGRHTPEEMLTAAKNKGFCALGFSEHAYNPLDLSCCLPEGEEKYIAHINRLKAENKGEIAIYTGLEIDAYEKRDTSKLDYFIGSVHGVRLNDKYYIVDGSSDEFESFITAMDGDVMDAISAYYAEYCTMAYALKPDILGHFDLVTKLNGSGSYFDESSAQYRDIALLALDSVLELGAILEVNTGAMARGYRLAPYPARFLLEHAKKRNARIIISSDAHNADTIDYGFLTVRELLKEIGFTEQAMLTDSGFVQTQL